MSPWVVVAAHREGDAALDNSRWMAREVAARAQDDARLLQGDEVTRERVEELARRGVPGLACFGHGTSEAANGSDGRGALDKANVGLLRGAWLHLVTCRSGQRLVRVAAQEGASCAVGYDTSITVQWDPGTIEPRVLAALAEFVSCITLALARGEADPRRLRELADARARDVEALLQDDGPGAGFGVSLTVTQMVDRLVVESPGRSHDGTAERR